MPNVLEVVTTEMIEKILTGKLKVHEILENIDISNGLVVFILNDHIGTKKAIRKMGTPVCPQVTTKAIVW